MNPWNRAIRDGAVSGGLAGLLSLVALALRGRTDTGSAVAPINAPSHWLWGDRALRQDRPSLRYTAIGLLIHQASAWMWGGLYEAFVGRRLKRNSVAEQIGRAAVATAGAATVDLVLTPRRFTPGFERRLSGRSLWMVYGAFAVGMAAGSYWLHRRGQSAGRTTD